MECELIKTKFGGEMLYVPNEKMLYVYDCTRNDKRMFVCYQTVLANKKKKDHSIHSKCTSSVRLLPNGSCERMNVHIPHTTHPNHEIIAADKRKTQSMKEKCEYLKVNFTEDAHKIPNRRIFQREIVQ